MANTHRGEVDISIDGRTYSFAMTLEALAMAAEALGVETLVEFEARIRELRIADMRPLLFAIAKGNGVDLAPDVLGGVHFSTFSGFLVQLYSARPGAKEPARDAEADPQKRGSKRAA